MFDQMIAKATIFDNLFMIHPSTSECGSEITPQSLGYEIEEAELAGELYAQSQKSDAPCILPEVSPQEFDAIYNWFLS
jgi:hypothetical protein